jgi:hypothetical protein
MYLAAISSGSFRSEVRYFLFLVIVDHPHEEIFVDEVSRKTLELFIEETEDLKKYISENSYGGLMGIFRRVKEEEWQIHPAIRGFLLTFRKFIQSGDGIALYVLERDSRGKPKRPKLLDLTGTSDSWHEKVEQAYKWVADALVIAPPNLIYNGEPITRWEILETFVYGKFAHANTTKRETFNQWRRLPDLFGNLQLEFVTVLMFMFDQIWAVAEASKHELERAPGSV